MIAFYVHFHSSLGAAWCSVYRYYALRIQFTSLENFLHFIFTVTTAFICFRYFLNRHILHFCTDSVFFSRSIVHWQFFFNNISIVVPFVFMCTFLYAV